MTEHRILYNTVAPLRNVQALVTMMDEVRNRQHGLPGMATFYGPSGYGKSTAAVYAVNEYDALHVQMQSVMTRKSLCQAILGEMSIQPTKTITDMVAQISRELTISERFLIIDEADYLVKQSMIEMVRDIYEASDAPIILIGEEQLPQKLQKWERVHGRMMKWVAAEPACLADIDPLAEIYCPNVELTPEFKVTLLEASRHSIRRVCTNLSAAAEVSKLKGAEVIDLATWGKRDFIAATAPSPRRELA